MNKAVFLDRDGTINVDKNYLYKIEDFEYLVGVKEALRVFTDLGYKLIVITNQSGIARGYYSEDDYRRLSEWMESDLENDGICLSGQYFCPHLPDAENKSYAKECDCRKPNIGLFLQAIKEHDIDVDNSIAIGDKDRDIAICRTTQGGNMRGYLVYSDNENTDGNIHRIKGGLLEVARMLQTSE